MREVRLHLDPAPERGPRTPHRRLSIAVAAMIGVLIVAGTTALAWHSARTSAKAGFDFEVERAAQLVRQELSELGMQLHAARGLIRGSTVVDADEWARFVHEVDADSDGHRSPAVGLAYVRRLDVTSTDSPPVPGFWRHATPIPVEDFVAPIVFHAPEERNQGMVGYDVSSRAFQRSALVTAARTNRPATTAPLRLEQAPDEWGSVVYLPVYRTAHPPDDPDARLAAVTGWIAAPIAVDWFLEAIIAGLPAGDRIAAVTLYSDPRDAGALPRLAHWGRTQAGDRTWDVRASIPVADRRWTLAVHGRPPTAGEMIAAVAPIASASSLVAGLLVALTVSTTGTRARALQLASKMTREVARTSALLTATGRLARLGTWEFTEGDTTMSWSTALCELHGVPPGYRPSLEESRSFLAPDSRRLAEEMMDRVRTTGDPWDEEMIMHRADDGERVIVRSLGSAERDQDGRLRFWGALQDITEHVAAREELKAAWEHAQAANRTKSAFLANMSHEIRTPMTAILGFVELMQELGPAVDADMQADSLATIRRNGEHLLEILNDILDLSKIEAGKMRVERIDTAVPELISEVTSLMRVRASAKDLHLRTRYETPIPAVVPTDPVRLRQIVSNLVGNAVKFTEEGGVTLAIRYDPHGEDAGTLLIAVEDTGIGMDEQQRARIFEAFSQADESMTRRFGGTGLGLRISATLAEMLGGGIDVTSEPGVGSRFVVRLAIREVAGRTMVHPDTGGGPGCEGEGDRLRSATVPAASAPAASPRTGGDAAPGPLAGRRVIIAEDGVDNQRLLRHVIERAGATVTMVENGQEVLDAITRGRTDDAGADDRSPFDLLLLDMQMPVMNGYRAARELRRLKYGLPIIAVTAHAMSDDRWKCIDAGCDDYATKPIDRAALVQTCRDVLDAAARSRRSAV